MIGLVRDRRASLEFIEFLQALDSRYPEGARIQVILDNHSAHTSKKTRAYLETTPNRFEFVFTPVHARSRPLTPVHGSWLNLIESFFAKMTHQVLRHIQVTSKAKQVHRLELYLREVNEHPVRFRWTHFALISTSDAHAISEANYSLPPNISVPWGAGLNPAPYAFRFRSIFVAYPPYTSTSAKPPKRFGRGPCLMNDAIWKRVTEIGDYILGSKATVRDAAKVFGVSKSTVHKDVTERLPKINPSKAREIGRASCRERV